MNKSIYVAMYLFPNGRLCDAGKTSLRPWFVCNLFVLIIYTQQMKQ